MTRREKAAQLHASGFNCAQSVLGACADLVGLDEKLAVTIAAGFGRGLNCGEVCGAVSGAVMALSMAYPFSDSADKAAKDRIGAQSRKLCERFREKYGYLPCRDLKAAAAPANYCNDYVDWCVMAVEEILAEAPED